MILLNGKRKVITSNHRAVAERLGECRNCVSIPVPAAFEGKEPSDSIFFRNLAHQRCMPDSKLCETDAVKPLKTETRRRCAQLLQAGARTWTNSLLASQSTTAVLCFVVKNHTSNSQHGAKNEELA